MEETTEEGLYMYLKRLEHHLIDFFIPYYTAVVFPLHRGEHNKQNNIIWYCVNILLNNLQGMDTG